MDDEIKYGDIVWIDAFLPNNVDPDNVIHGMLVSKGFTDNDLYFAYNQQQTLSRQNLFKILPKSSFEIHDEAASYGTEEHADIESRKEKEIEQFLNNVKIMDGHNIHFGEQFILKHVLSNSYLKGCFICGEAGFGSFKLELTIQFSSDILFQVEPYRSFEKEGQKFKYQTPFRLHHLHSNSYINYIQKQIFLCKLFDDIHPINQIKYQTRYPTVNQSKSKLMLRMHLHPKLEQIKIQHQDVVYLQYSKNMGYLGCDIHENTIHIKQNKYKKPCYEAIWEVHYAKDQQVYLRHYIYKKILGVDMFGKVQLIDDMQNRLTIKPVTLKSFIESRDLVNLVHRQQILASKPKYEKIYLNKLLEHCQSENTYFPLEMCQETAQHSFKIIKVDQKTKQLIDYMLSSTELLVKFRCFLALGIDKSMVENIIIVDFNQFLQQSIQNTLQRLHGKLYETEYKHIKTTHNKMQHETAIVMKDLGVIDIIVELIEVFGVIYENLKGFDEFSGKGNEIDNLMKIFESCYHILEHLCFFADLKVYISQYLQLFLRQFYEIKQVFVAQFVFKIFENNHLSISSEIRKSDIEYAVNSFIEFTPVKSSYIKLLRFFCYCGKESIKSNQDLVKNLLFTPDNKYVIYFSFSEETINIVYDQKSVPLLEFFEFNCKNQLWNYVYQYLQLLADLSIHQNTENSKFISSNIISYETICAIINSRQLKTIQKSCQGSVRTILNPLIRVVHCCYIDVQGFETIRRIAKVRQWKDIHIKNVILKSHSAKKQKQSVFINKVIDFILNFLKDLQPTTGFQANRTLLSVLQLLRSTITLGFWKDIQQFRDLIPFLIKIIKYDSMTIIKQIQQNVRGKKFTNNQLEEMVKEKKAEMNFQNTKEYLACKVRALDIIDIIMDMETNIRISLLTYFFKGLYWYTIDFDKYMKKVQLEFNNQEDRKPEDNVMGFMKQLKHKKQPDLFSNQNLWINRMKELTPIEKEEVETKIKRYLFDRFVSIEEVFLALMELSEYKNYELMNFGLLIMRRIFGQRKDLMDNFENVIIVAEGDFNKMSKKSRQEIRSKLKFLQIPNIRQLTVEKDEKESIRIWKPYDATEQIEEKKKSGVIQDLCYLIEMMKMGRKVNDNSLKNLYRYEDLGGILTIYTERDYPNSLYQKLIKNQDSHLMLLKYIELINNPDSNEIHLKCLHSIYNYMTMLVWNHSRNKSDLTKEFRLATKHLKWNIGVADFLRELLKNNKVLVKSDLSWFIYTLLDVIISKSNQDYYKSKLLDIFRSITIFNDKGVKKHQLEILSAFQKTKFQFIQIDNIEAHLDQYDKQLKKLSTNAPEQKIQQYFIKNKLLISAELTYLITFFQTFSCLIESKHEVNIGKCSNIHTYSYLLQLISKARGCWPLLRHLRGYINRLYYIPVDYNILMFEEFIKSELGNLAKETQNYLNDFQENYDNFSKIIIKYPIRFSYLSSYAYCSIIEIVTSFYEMLTKPKFVDHLKHCIKTNRQVLEEVLNLIELLGYVHLRILKRKSKTKFLLSYLKQIKAQFLQLLDVIPFKYMEQKYDKEFSYEEGDQEINLVNVSFFYDYSKTFFRNFIDMLGCIKINRLRERIMRSMIHRNQPLNLDEFTKKIKYIDLMFSKVIKRFENYKIYTNQESGQEIKHNYQQKIILHHSRSFNVLGKAELTDDAQNQTLNEIHEHICQNMQNEEVYQNYKNNEFMKFVKLFLDFDNIQKQYYKEDWSKLDIKDPINMVTMKDFILSVIEMIKNDPKAIKNDSKIGFVKMLRLFITETIQEGKQKLSVDKWTADYIQEELKLKLAERQQFLIKANCHQLIFSIFKESLCQNISLLNELLLLCISVLFGGNTYCQTALLNEMIKDKDNLMLISIEEIIRYMGRELYKATKIKDGVTDNKFHISHEDSFDYYNSKDRVMERKFIYCYDPIEERNNKKEKTQALNRIFRFLQLLCENNNVDMKQFLRLQKDHNGNQRPNSINFIEKTTLLLRKFFKIMNINIIDIPLFLLDFVNQVTQLPCQANQIAFCKSSYLEDLCFMEIFMTPDKMRMRLIQEKEDVDKLYQIYNKSVTLVLSNMEGNDAPIYEQIRQKLSLTFLRSLTIYNFKEILNEFAIEYDQTKPITEHNVNIIMNKIKSEQLPDSYTNIINILALLRKENDNRAEGQEDRHKQYLFESGGFEPLIRFDEQILRIEVNLFSRQYIYFPKHSLFSALSRETRKNIMQNVDRQTQRDKLNGLFGYTDELIEEMQLFQNLNTSGYNYWRNIALYISCIINVLILFTINIDLMFEDEYVDYYYDNILIWLFVKMLSFAQLSCAFLYLTMWIRIRSQLAVKKENRRQQNLIVDEHNTYIENAHIKQFKLRIKPLTERLYVVQSLYNHENEFTSIVLFMSGSIAGAFLGPQFFSLHLIDLFSRTSILKSVFEAITSNARQLLTVSLLGVFFIYTFTIISLSFNVYTIPEDKEICENVIDCILSIYVSGTIGDDMETFQFWKFLADLVYIVVMELLFSNIVSGIMIDTFAELKDKKKVILEDMKNNCFICGITRSDVQKKNKNFEHHIKQEHYLWNYIFYIYCLKKKDETDYSGIEYSIAQKLEKEDLGWIPIEEEQQAQDSDNQNSTGLILNQIKIRLQQIIT